MVPFARPLPSTKVLLRILVIALTVAFLLGMVAQGPGTLPSDVEISHAIQEMDGPVVDGVEDVGEHAGSKKGAATVMSVTLLFVATFRLWSDLLFLATLLVLRIVATIIKPLVDSHRPSNEVVEVIGRWDGGSYPSEHTMSATTMALGIAMIVWRRIPDPRIVSLTVVGALGICLLAGWARIWTGAHWASDIVGSYSIGIAIVAIALVVQRSAELLMQVRSRNSVQGA
jgi:membrane-associated phospholipid phosphatase